MRASIVTIGDEILIGQIIDTNSAWIAENLSILGISITEMMSVSDNREHIISTLERYESHVDLVVLTGGLGPTRDDITKQTLADYFNTVLVENREVLGNIRRLFGIRGMKVTEINEKQAMVPATCKILNNPSGTAPGMWFERNGTIFISLPGVPYELIDIFTQSLLPELTSRLNGMVVAHRTIMTQGIPESYLSEMIKDWEVSLPINIKLAYLPRPGIVRLRLTGAGSSRESIDRDLSTEIEKLKMILPSEIFSLSDEPLENVIGTLLKEGGKTLVTAESCTGGNIARLITSIPGSSIYYKGSVIAYSNNIKTKQLNVDPSIIEKYGAVSREVVERMAEGARNIFDADYAIATSGIAGPGGGSSNKPVGTTWIAIADHKTTLSKHFYFGEHRGRNIEKASYSALSMLRKMILGIPF